MSMSSIKRLLNCRIIIKELSGDSTLADTKIKDFDWKANVAFIESSSLIYEYFGEVYVLIFCGNSLIEYKGLLKKTIISNEIAIQLYKRREKEDRKCGRYDFVTIGELTHINFGRKKVALRKPFDIKTINISSSGILLETISDSMEIKNQFMIELPIDIGRTSLECEVVRMQNDSLRTVEYGCRILLMKVL